MVQKKAMGSLYLDDQLMIPSSLCMSNTTIRIGDTVPGKELMWIPDGKRLIADRCVCLNVNWKQLDRQGLVFGTPMVVDGQTYMCRCLKVGAGRDEPNEWDDLLNRIGNKDALWHWKNQKFWGQELVDGVPLAAIVRGGKTSRAFEMAVPGVSLMNLGFRPVLEPVSPLPSNLSGFVGKRIRVYGPGGKDIIGLLVSTDEYDLVLENPVFRPGQYNWVISDGSRAIANRNRVSFVQEA